MTNKRVAIVGTAPSSRYAPFKDESWDIWGVGARAEHVTRATRWFELHRLDGETPQWAADWRAMIKQWSHECEIWMFYPEPDLGPKIVQMDVAPLTAKYGTFFMTSSFAWMLAQALEENYEEIGLWGVDMEYGTEYRQQRVGLRHFIEVAKLMGRKVTRVASSGIAYDPVPYPLWQDDPMQAKNRLRRGAHKEQIQSSKFTLEQMQEKIHRAQGVRSFLLEAAGEGVPLVPPDMEQRAKRLEEEIAQLNKGALIARDDLKLAEGSLAECNWLEDYLQP